MYKRQAKYWANGDVGRENSLDAAYTKLGFADVKYRYYDVDVGKAGDFVGWSTARKTITPVSYTHLVAEGVTFQQDFTFSKGVKSAAKQQIGGELKCG